MADMNKETDLQNLILIEVSKRCPNVRLFRNNVGMAYQGKSVMLNSGEHKGQRAVLFPRAIAFGLIEGSSDLIGLTEVIYNGKKIAIFTALEVKLNDKSKISDEQRNFIEFVKNAGGIAGIVCSVEEAIELIKNPDCSPGF